MIGTNYSGIQVNCVCSLLIIGIDVATWQAQIGHNYYHMCGPLQTRWRSSGGQLYQPEVASWGVPSKAKKALAKMTTYSYCLAKVHLV